MAAISRHRPTLGSRLVPRLRIRTLLWLVGLAAVILFVEQTQQAWQRHEKRARLYGVLEYKELREMVMLNGLIAEQRSVLQAAREADESRPRESAEAAALQRVGDWSRQADAARARADEYARLKREYRSRWW